MNNVVKIAFGSLWQHKVKTFVAGTVLFIGAFLLFTGQTFSTAVRGAMQKIVTRTFTGDLVVASLDNEGQPNLLDTKALKTITNSEAIITLLQQQDNVKAAVKMGKGVAQLHVSEKIPETPTLILGADVVNYKKVFTLFKLVKGKEVQSGVSGIWLNEEYLANSFRGKVTVGDKITCLVMNRNGFLNSVNVRVQGVFRMEGMKGFSSFMNIIDIASYRTLYGMQDNGGALNGINKKVVKKNANYLGSGTDIEKLLQTDVVSSKGVKSDTIFSSRVPPKAKKKTVEADKKRQKKLSEFIAVALKNPQLVDKTVTDLNNLFKKNGVRVRAYHWTQVSGQLGQLLMMIGVVLVALIVVIFCMLLIIIMNAMLMAALERIYEIGTMRAIGASRSFIVKTFLAESFFLGLFFGGGGALFAGILFKGIGQISATNQMTMMLFGGPSLQIPVDVGVMLTTIVLVTCVAMISSVYPAWVASRFSPIEAMREE